MRLTLHLSLFKKLFIFLLDILYHRRYIEIFHSSEEQLQRSILRTAHYRCLKSVHRNMQMNANNRMNPYARHDSRGRYRNGLASFHSNISIKSDSSQN